MWGTWSAVDTQESSSIQGVGEWLNTWAVGMQHSSLELHPIPERTHFCCWSRLDSTTNSTETLRLPSPVLTFTKMRVIFSASWIFQGWITHFVLALCTQVSLPTIFQINQTLFLCWVIIKWEFINRLLFLFYSVCWKLCVFLFFSSMPNCTTLFSTFLR